MIASFLCNGIIFGIINTFGVFFVSLKEKYKGDEAATKAAIVGSMAIGATFFLSSLSGVLADR